jgi:hypothetical protein
MARFEVVADQLWHSTECRMYTKGDVVEFPDTLQVDGKDVPFKPGKSLKPVKAKKQAETADDGRSLT